MTIVPVEFSEACLFVEKHHRHHKPPTGHKFSIAVSDEHDRIRGIAIVGRPVSRMRDDGWTLEVLRLATDGFPNACSMLYARCAKIAYGMGYRRIGTYILETESGTSLRAAGWKLIKPSRGGSWSRSARPRINDQPLIPKLLWEAPSQNGSIGTTFPANS